MHLPGFSLAMVEQCDTWVGEVAKLTGSSLAAWSAGGQSRRSS